MGIKIPGYHLKSKYYLPTFRKRMAGPAGGRDISAELNLTSLIDLFSVLILYLIATFSATGEVIVAQKNLQLPTAKHGRLLMRSPIVTVTQNGVALEGSGKDKVLDIERIEESDWEMPQLRAKLRQYKQTWEVADPGVPFPGNIVIQADANLDLIYLKRVLYNLVEEGYNGINLVVRGEAHFAPKPESR